MSTATSPNTAITSQPRLLRPVMALLGLTLAAPFAALLIPLALSIPMFGDAQGLPSAVWCEFAVAAGVASALPFVIGIVLLFVAADNRLDCGHTNSDENRQLKAPTGGAIMARRQLRPMVCEMSPDVLIH